MFYLTIFSAAVAVAAAGAMTGLFYGFSTAVMPGLDGIRPDDAVAAMRSINRRILNAGFYVVFFAALLAPAVTGVLLLVLGETAAAVTFFAAAGAYLVGSFMTTVIVNVPMNEALDRGEITAWADYSPRWTRWNTLRGTACLLALLLAAGGGYLWAA